MVVAVVGVDRERGNLRKNDSQPGSEENNEERYLAHKNVAHTNVLISHSVNGTTIGPPCRLERVRNLEIQGVERFDVLQACQREMMEAAKKDGVLRKVCWTLLLR